VRGRSKADGAGQVRRILPFPVKALKIGSYQVAVKAIGGDDKKESWGVFYCNDYEIHLQEKYPTRQKAGEVALHEALHVVWDERGLSDSDGEERIVTSMSRGIFALLRDNPEFREWLVKMTA
jgi:hypothetical protein